MHSKASMHAMQWCMHVTCDIWHSTQQASNWTAGQASKQTRLAGNGSGQMPHSVQGLSPGPTMHFDGVRVGQKDSRSGSPATTQPHTKVSATEKHYIFLAQLKMYDPVCLNADKTCHLSASEGVLAL